MSKLITWFFIPHVVSLHTLSRLKLRGFSLLRDDVKDNQPTHFNIPQERIREKKLGTGLYTPDKPYLQPSLLFYTAGRIVNKFVKLTFTSITEISCFYLVLPSKFWCSFLNFTFEIGLILFNLFIRIICHRISSYADNWLSRSKHNREPNEAINSVSIINF